MTCAPAFPRRGSAADVLLAAALGLSMGAWAPAAERGSADLDSFRETVLGFSDLVGSVDAESVRYWSFPPAKGVQGKLVITPERDWRFENVRATFCKGRLAARAEIDFRREPRTKREFRLEWRAVGIDLEEIARQMDYPVPTGIATASLELCVTSEGLSGLSGRGEGQLRNGSFWQAPGLLKVVSVVGLRFPRFNQAKFENIDAKVVLTPRAIVVEDLVLSTADGAYKLVAGRLGTLGYDGKLDLHFLPDAGGGLEALPLGEVAGEIVDTVWSNRFGVRVRGTLAEPRFQWAPFR